VAHEVYRIQQLQQQHKHRRSSHHKGQLAHEQISHVHELIKKKKIKEERIKKKNTPRRYYYYLEMIRAVDRTASV